jgi:hypothetical protein
MTKQKSLLCALLTTAVITCTGVSFADEPIINDPIPATIKPIKLAVKFQSVARGFTMPLWLTHAGDNGHRKQHTQQRFLSCHGRILFSDSTRPARGRTRR